MATKEGDPEEFAADYPELEEDTQDTSFIATVEPAEELAPIEVDASEELK